MNTKVLTFKGDEAPQLYACGKCGVVFSPKIYAGRDDLAHEQARRSANECCAVRHCACGAALEKGRTICAPCLERNKLKRAKIIDAKTYEGAVCADVTGEWGDGYSSNIVAMLQSCEEHEEPAPAYCHPCTEQHLRLDADRLLEQATEEMHEGAYDQVVDAKALAEFLNAWNAKQNCVSYFEDRSRIIVLDQMRFEALIKE